MSKKNDVHIIIKESGLDAVRFLIIYKLLKNQLQNEPSTRKLQEIVLNKICADAAKDLLIDSKAIPTNDEIKTALKQLTIKLEALPIR